MIDMVMTKLSICGQNRLPVIELCASLSAVKSLYLPCSISWSEFSHRLNQN